MFKRQKLATFDDVASDDAKRVRAEIYAAARKRLREAAGHASRGSAKFASEAQQEALDLHSLALTIPLDMIEMGL